MIHSLPAEVGVTPVAARWTRALFARACLVDRECAPGNFLAVECSHGRSSFSGVVHRDECEAAGFARHAIHHQRNFGDFAVLLEKILKIVLGGLKERFPTYSFIVT